MSLKHIFVKAGKLIYKYRPEILLGAGFVSIVGGTVLACNASRKLDDILDESADNIDKARELGGVAADKAIRKEKATCAFKIAKEYAPGAVLLGGGMVLVGLSHSDLRERLSDVGFALNNSVAAMAFYRSNVRRRFGDDVDRQMLYGTSQVEVSELPYTDEDGVEHPMVKKTVEVGDGDPPVPIAFRFGPDNPNWRGSLDLNQRFLYFVETSVNTEAAKYHACFNDVIAKYLGTPEQITGIHRLTGKMLTPEECIKAKHPDITTGDYPIHLGIYEATKYRESERSNAHDVEYILVPNTQDYIIEEYDNYTKNHKD